MTREQIFTTILSPFMTQYRRYVERSAPLHLPHSAWDCTVSGDGHLLFGGCDAVELTREYGTPLHVVEENALQRNYRQFSEQFASHGVPCGIYYSYKTNPVPGILNVLHASGAGAEVISPYELWLALRIGVKPERIIYNGPNKSIQGLRTAIERRIKLINLNSWQEIRHVTHLSQEMKTPVNVGIRVNMQVGWGENQFGFSIPSGQAFEAVKAIDRIEALSLKGIHCHLETNIRSASLYEQAIEEICRLLHDLKSKQGIRIEFLDLGGGFGIPTVRPLGKIEFNLNRLFHIPYRAPDVQACDMSALVGQLVTRLREECQRYALDLPSLLCEPGRALTGNAQVLLAQVGEIKQTRTGKIAMIDAGINIANPVTWEYHEIVAANKMNAAYTDRYDMTGPICTPNDVLYIGKTLPRLERGDIVAMMDAGAYFTAFSTNFSFPRPPVVMAADGQHRVIRERERFEDMIRRDKE